MRRTLVARAYSLLTPSRNRTRFLALVGSPFLRTAFVAHLVDVHDMLLTKPKRPREELKQEAELTMMDVDGIKQELKLAPEKSTTVLSCVALSDHRSMPRGSRYHRPHLFVCRKNGFTLRTGRRWGTAISRASPTSSESSRSLG